MSKKIGILGGLGPASTLLYYGQLIEKYLEKEEDEFFPEIILYSLSLGKMEKIRRDNEKNYVKELLRGVKALAKAGADFVIIASNSPHAYFEELKKRSPVPLLSIVDATLKYAKEMGLKRLLLLGTKFTMSSGFYPQRADSYGMKIIVPDPPEQEIIDHIIFKELVRGVVKEHSRKEVITIVEKYKNMIDAIILGCTELSLLIGQSHVTKPLIDSLQLHVEAALSYALEKE